MRNILAATITALILTSIHGFTHCQVPCGIYGDAGRFATLQEHVSTIEKAMTQINMLAGAHGAQDAQQLARWVSTKESHAQDIQQIALDYFLAQRIKLPASEAESKAYAKKLSVLHSIIVYAMKCKQTVDPGNTAKLKEAITKFESLYNGKPAQTVTPHDHSDHSGHNH